MRALALLLLLPLLAACGAEDASPTVRLQVEAAPAITRPVDVEDDGPADLSEGVEAKIASIREILDRNSLTRLSRLADSEPAFVSNFAGESNRVHWDLLRRTGFDPLAQLGLLLDGPYGVREVGDETWYIWPDLAALQPEDLVPERLSFADRARLLDLVGEEGIERIRGGQGYPGVRTAIAEDGRWLYFIHESEDMATTEGQD
ncbi:MAG: hypothetical protein QNI84_07385 [Henriciella sp.]|nr:hypothetical protein [Henriciella sp.]